MGPPDSIASRAYVLLRDQTGKKVAVFEDFFSLSLTRTVNDVCSYSFSIDGNDPRRNSFQPDGQIEVWRGIPGVLKWYKEFQGFHITQGKAMGDDGKITFTSSGVGYNDLLARRVIAFKSGTIRAAKNCSAETAMKQYVDENCTKDLMTVVGRLSDGYFPNFSIEGDKTATSLVPIQNWAGDKAFENLLDVLKEIATLSGIDFEVIGTGPAEFTFVTYLEQMGSNRTYSTVTASGKNEYGNVPVVFGAVFGSVQSAEYSLDRMSEANVVIVQGKGDGSTKHTLTVSDSKAIAVSPWNMREVSRSASSSDFEYQLRDFGNQTLKEMAAKEVVSSCVPLQTPSSLYGKNYFLGDKITVWFDDVKMNKRIVSVTLDYTDIGEKVSMELADIP
jgi:hypothetical protein